MDRRQALKKLGVGSAVAVSAPILLDAFNVAHACSTDVTAAEAVPSPPLVQGNNIVIQFSTAAFNCSTTPTFDWFLDSATPPVELTATGPTGTVKKVGSLNPANFQITVNVSNGATLIATYVLVGAPDALVTVSRTFPST